MLSRWSGKFMLMLAGCAALLPAAWAADNQAGWKVLKEVTHRRNYEFLLRGGNCLTGWIERMDDGAVEVRTSSNGKPVMKTLARPDILHVGDTLPGLVYSARSSWADVLSAAADSRLRMRVSTKAGQTIEGTAAGASESELTVKTEQGEKKTAKPEVARVELVREKPWSDRAEFAGQELGRLAVIEPEIWPHLLHVTGKISVPLYDSSVVEDNTDAKCATWQY